MTPPSTSNTPTPQELYEKLTASYEPLWAAEAAVQENAIALIKAVVKKHFPDATRVGLDWSDQTEGRVVSDGGIEGPEGASPYDVEDIPDDERELFDHAISDLRSSDLKKDAAGYPTLDLD